jgi:AraC-like DNA-binding protein
MDRAEVIRIADPPQPDGGDRFTHRSFANLDSFQAALAADMIACSLRGDPSGMTAHRLAARHVGGIRLVELLGSPARGERRTMDIATDSETYLKVMFQREGRSVYTQRTVGARQSRQTIVQRGDIAIWHSGRPAKVDFPDPFREFIMMIPVGQIESVLPNAESYEGLLMKAGSQSASLLGGWLTILADTMLGDGSEPLEPAIDMTLEVIGTAMHAAVRQRDCRPRTTLFERATQYIERRLGDPELTPAAVAGGLNISLRYLYVQFSEQGTTVAHWIRSRRLARCRADLSDRGNDRSITEIAFQWGFSDAAHFSRLFKSAHGEPPHAFRIGQARAKSDGLS